MSLVRFDSYSPHGPFEPLRVHPSSEHRRGPVRSVVFLVRGQEVRLGASSGLEIAPGTPHTFRNERSEDGH